MKNIIVSGAGGFIGKYVVTVLLDRGYEVIALTHKHLLEERKHLRVICDDICGRNFVNHIIAQVDSCDAVIHLAADLSMQEDEGVINTNGIGTLHMIEISNFLSVKSFIFMSSIPVIGIPKIIPITEQHPICPRTLYHIMKYAGEQMVECLCKKDMKKVIIRIPSPIGIGMNQENYLSMLLNRCMNQRPIEIYGRGSRVQNYIDVRDIAVFVADVLQDNMNGLYLIAGKKSISNLKLAYLCKELTGSVSTIRLGSVSDPADDMKWIISCEKAEQEAGFSSRYTLEKTIQWIKEESLRT